MAGVRPARRAGLVAFAMALASVFAISPLGLQPVLAASGPGTVIGWGADNLNQRGVPPYLSDAIAISAGANHSLALRTDGSVIAWGDDAFGQAHAGSVLAGPPQGH